MAEAQDNWRKCFAETRSCMDLPCLKIEGVGEFSPTSLLPLGGSQGIACKSSFRLDQRLHHPVNEMKEAEHLDYRLTREKRIQLNVIEYRLKAVRIFMNMI